MNLDCKGYLMRKFFTHCTILATIPSFLVYPLDPLPHSAFQVVDDSYQKEAWTFPNTYDGIIQMLGDVESCTLEKSLSPMQWERIQGYVIALAREGILPNQFEEKQALEEDIQDLLYGEQSASPLTHYLEDSQDYRVFPAILNGPCNVIWCGKNRTVWQKTKTFVKKHRKAILIGAIVVVAVSSVTVAVIAASAAKATSFPNNAQPTTSDTPIFQSILEEQVVSFKERLAQEDFFQVPVSLQELPLEETGRVIGSLSRDEGTYVRVMPGKVHSNNPCQ